MKSIRFARGSRGPFCVFADDDIATEDLELRVGTDFYGEGRNSRDCVERMLSDLKHSYNKEKQEALDACNQWLDRRVDGRVVSRKILNILQGNTFDIRTVNIDEFRAYFVLEASEALTYDEIMWIVSTLSVEKKIGVLQRMGLLDANGDYVMAGDWINPITARK
jgi:hypothetical protein